MDHDFLSRLQTDFTSIETDTTSYLGVDQMNARYVKAAKSAVVGGLAVYGVAFWYKDDDKNSKGVVAALLSAATCLIASSLGGNLTPGVPQPPINLLMGPGAAGAAYWFANSRMPQFDTNNIETLALIASLALVSNLDISGTGTSQTVASVSPAPSATSATG